MSTDFPKKILTIVVVIFIIQFFFFSFVLATDSGIQFKPQVSIPGFEGGPIGNTTAKIGEYIKAFYVFGISALALLSVVMIAWAGITWLTAGGSAEKVGTAKARILGALGGLALGLVSYVILQTINPALVDFKLSTIAPVDPLYMQNVVTNKLCDASMKDAQGKPIACGSIYAAKSPDITPKKEEQEIEGCMGFTCYEYPFQCVACQLYKNANGEYTGGQCLGDAWCNNKITPIQNKDGVTLQDVYATLKKDVNCGEIDRNWVRDLINLFSSNPSTDKHLYVGTQCPNPSSQTCVLEDNSFKIPFTGIDWLTLLKNMASGNNRVLNMACKP